MKYPTSKLGEQDCPGVYSFGFDEEQVDSFSFRTLVLSNAIEPEHQADHFAFAMAVVASEPPFLRTQDCSWILSYLHDLRLTNVLELRRRGRGMTNLVWHYAQENDAISVIRLMYAIDVAEVVLSGGWVLEHDYFTSEESWDAHRQRYMIEFLDDEEISDVRANLDVQYDKSLKRDLTQRVFSGVEVKFSIPDDEELFTNLGGAEEVFTVKHLVGSIKRFYKTELFWSNRGVAEFYPRFKGLPRCRLISEPLIPVELQFLRDAQWYGSPIAYIPLHWITSVAFRGQHSPSDESLIPGEMRFC